jgi:hypothetical protein
VPEAPIDWRERVRNPIFVDEEKVCRDCGKPFVVTAREKRYWHDTLGVTSHFSPDACKSCRRERRSARALNTQMTQAARLAARRPDDAAALLTLARATAEVVESSRTGSRKALHRGIEAARRARRIEPKLQEARYWEAACEHLAGRTETAMRLYAEFIESAQGIGRCWPLVETARERIADAAAADAETA